MSCACEREVAGLICVNSIRILDHNGGLICYNCIMQGKSLYSKISRDLVKTRGILSGRVSSLSLDRRISLDLILDVNYIQTVNGQMNRRLQMKLLLTSQYSRFPSKPNVRNLAGEVPRRKKERSMQTITSGAVMS